MSSPMILTDEKTILTNRAILLAQEKTSLTPHDAGIYIATFWLDNEQYGVAVDTVHHLSPLTEFTLLPWVPTFIAGITNIHGKIVALIDLKQVNGMSSSKLGANNYVMYIQSPKTMVRIIIDKPGNLLFIAQHLIQSTSLTLATSLDEYIEGVTQDNIIIFNSTKFIDSKKIEVMQHL